MGGDPSPADERRREKKRFAQRKRRYDQSVNSLKAELDAMRKAAESEIEEIKKRAFEEADSIRESARGDVVGACGASTMTSSHEAQRNSTVVGRNDADEASSILRFAQAFATEVRDEATRVLANARAEAEAEQLLSNARANGAAVPSSGSATIADREKMRREREASRKRRKYWETRSWPDDSTEVQESAVLERDKGERHIRRIVSELVNLFNKSTRSFSLKICEASEGVCRAPKATVQSVRQWCEEIMCPKAEGNAYNRKECLNGDCAQCGSSHLKVCRFETNPASNLNITWHMFQYVALDAPSRSRQTEQPEGATKVVKRLKMVQRRTLYLTLLRR
ncbi:hypothetical protein R1sor_001763 [Riccia sorocarpa]|uniref:BZIP domain-containing protein n=1 Tax=Riccia sorocarpa TaxID=122646 RepID=A0ABD3H125_9MARC